MRPAPRHRRHARLFGRDDALAARAGKECGGNLDAISRRSRRRKRRSRRILKKPGVFARNMKKFAELYVALDQTTRTGEKVQELARYLSDAPAGDAAWAVYFLIGRKPRQAVSARKLTSWAIELAGIPEWLFGESYDAVGDLAETISLLVPPAEASSDRPLSEWVEQWLLPLSDMDEAGQRLAVVKTWAEMDTRQLFVWNKLVTGAFRVGVSRTACRACAGTSQQVRYEDHCASAHGRLGPDPLLLREPDFSGKTR